MQKHSQRGGFTLLEVLVVGVIISLLAAMLLPTFWTVRGRARQTVCTSNLRHIGEGIALYSQDYDGLYPFAVDPTDKFTPQIWRQYPDFQALIPQMPQVQDVLRNYTSEQSLFHCPADIGFTEQDLSGMPMDGMPSSFEKFGTSYLYRTEIAFRRAGDPTFQNPSEINVFMDASGRWHGTLLPLAQRYNMLFADGHVKNLTRLQAEEAWHQPLIPPS